MLMKFRLTLALLVLIFAGLACSLPASPSSTAAGPSPTFPAPSSVTATPTPLTARHYFFEEEFTGDFLGWKTQVTSGDASLLDLATKDGYLVFDIGQKNLNALAFFQAGAYKNVWIDLRVVNQGGTGYAMDLLCRYDNVQGWYQFEVFNSGLFNLYYMQWDSDMHPQATLLTKGGSNAMRPGAAPNDLTMICKDRTLSLYIKGELVISYEENQYALRAGQVGIGVSSFEEIPVVVKLDWMKLETP